MSQKQKKNKRVGKKIFEEFADYKCARQLFLTLAEVAQNDGKSSWRQPNDILLPRVRTPTRAALATKIGQDYERLVYIMLERLNERLRKKDGKSRVHVTRGPVGIGKTYLKPNFLKNLANSQLDSDQILIEHQYPVVQSFHQDKFGLSADDNRPDIIYIRQLKNFFSQANQTIGFLDSQGEVQYGDVNTLQDKIGLNVIDIKSVYKDRVGIRYFNELHYYLQTLNAFLHEYQLQDIFVVLIDGNGILTRNDDILFTDLTDVFDETVILEYEATLRLYTQTIDKIREIRSKIPLDRNHVSLNFTPKCERCIFLDDCLFQCGYDSREEDENKKKIKPHWDLNRATVDLLPNMPKATIAELKNKALGNVREVAKKANELQLSEDPHPINKDIPLIKLSSKAINNDEIEYANPNQIYSVAIPKYSRINVVITAESDSTTERIFGFGIFVGISLPNNSKAKYKEKYRNWWEIWKAYVDKNSEYNKDGINTVVEQLQEHVSPDIHEADVIVFAKGLYAFDSNDLEPNRSLEILLDGDALPSGHTLNSIARIRFVYINVNNSLKHEGEFRFTKQIVSMLSHLIKMIMIMEQFLVEEQGINAAVYYWSPEIIEKIKGLLEKHFKELISDINVRRDLDIISQWINPSERVADPNQTKKVFDLSQFVRTTFGLSLPVNYTWHKVVNIFLKKIPRANRMFWSDLFNNMDRNQWHNFIRLIEESKMQEAMKTYKQIQAQIYNKIFRLYLLVVRFQIDRGIRNLISQSTRPEKTRSSLRAILPRYYKLPAVIWYYFASLTETSGELASRELRTMYPEYSIGKLEAAIISKIKREQVPKLGREKKNRFIYSLELKGLSKNIKAKEGDFFYLIPEIMRDRINQSTKWTWQVQIASITWNSEKNALELTTQRTTLDMIIELQKFDEYNHIRSFKQISATSWYLYPASSGNWADKLYNQRNPINSLLARNNLGSSWLSERFAFINQIYQKTTLTTPENLKFSSQELYMFAPDLLDQIVDDSSRALITHVKPQPDSSQTSAILFALSGKIRLIQGPPGTGKSKTIIALIDEFLHRQKNKGRKTSRILVTGFSYNAMNVILNNLPISINTQGKPTLAAQTQKIFVRSIYREEVSLKGDQAVSRVHNLLKTSSTHWEFDGEEIKLKSEKKLEDYLEDNCIFFSNAHQLHHLARYEKNKYIVSHELLQFDLIVVDEASQLPADHLLAILNHVRSNQITLDYLEKPLGEDLEHFDVTSTNLIVKDQHLLETQVVIVGDNNQLPPVQPLKPPDSLKVLLGSSFDYFRQGFNLEPFALKFNYRSHELIVQFTESLGIYPGLEPAQSSIASNKLLAGYIDNVASEWVRDVLDPNKVIVSLVHKQEFDSGVSLVEANLAVELILGYFKMINPQDKESQLRFWEKEIGIVAPHNAQGRTIINMTFRRLNEENLNLLDPQELMNGLRNTIFSVEKFQGSERSMIIATIGVSAGEQLQAEEEFIYDRNRLNVLTSRAKSKMILISSENFLNYIPQDKDRFFDVWICNHLTYDFCENKASINFEMRDMSYLIDFYFQLI